ncbi:type I restriction endonuclease subunit R [Neisseria sp. ZJ106]|uniref:Type I restriction enzyme endonuclease subunit n=1 Tax=Neisseria lisongii TaxID=2912188 RepID=A0ABY7RJ83_9NEIS|nr:type I restriction endonuclease subunit R [Neisseria lisongii]MCF7520673.1 type I restriction endonuclease subunit R [Neisseria lisongii]WCL71394.1 type I restriction endonuclease subunit R [Neisseria lisongii]
MLKINEDTVEQACLQVLQGLGWRYTDGRTVLPDGDNPWRGRLSDVVLHEVLAAEVRRLNPDIPAAVCEAALGDVLRVAGDSLGEQNRRFYDYLCHGVPAVYQADGEQKRDLLRLVDFGDWANNRFDVVNQFSIAGSRGKRRPDIVCFVNGLPLVVFELKNPLREEADLESAFLQLQTYQKEIGDLFVYNQVQVVSDGMAARLGSLTAPFNRFMPWRVVDEKNQSRRVAFENELEALLHGLLQPETLLDYVFSFVMFERGGNELLQKKIAAYHQFYGVNEAVDSTVAAMGSGNGKIGVVWHTQGSGKSLSMLFYAAKLMRQPVLGNPTIVVVTDRNDLDGQLFATFSGGADLIREMPVQADGREDLRAALAKQGAGGVVFTTIQKFGLAEGESVHPVLNDRHNIVVISDEAHRSQYGFTQKINDKGEYRTGYAKHLRDALPNASFIGFTGTPISLEDKDTREVFGRYVSIYDIHDAVEDGATVPIIYEARQIALQESGDFQQLMREAQMLADEDENSRNFRLREQLMGTQGRLKKLAEDLVGHFEKRTELAEGKAMVVAMSRTICVNLYNEIVKLRPQWHSDDVHQGTVKIMMTGSASDPQEMRPHIYPTQDKKTLEQRFKDPDDPLKMVIVRDMWLTGFDAPCCHTMYIDKPMQGHNLMQAIARVNRVFKNKSRENGGLIVDYVGLTEELQQATRQYTNAGGKSRVKHDIDEIFTKMLEYIDIIRGQMATPVDGKKPDIQTALQLTDPTALLTAIRQAANHILGLDRVLPANSGKDKTPRKSAFLQAVRLAKKGFSLCGALKQAEPYRQELAFYDAVRATLAKAEHIDGKNRPKERQLQLAALLNKAVQSDGVVDLFDLLQQERPDITVLSEEFLEMFRNSDSKDLWVLAAESYLKSEIRTKAATNLAIKKSFEEKLKEAMAKYHNHNLTVFEIITELVEMAKSFQESIRHGEQLGLSPAELAFYHALARNSSAAEIMGDAALLKLAHEITALLRRSVSIDWQYKEAVRAGIRIKVKRILKSFKYPPDCQEEAIDFVLQQAEVIADELSNTENG